MTDIYVVTIKATGKQYFYKSRPAMANAHQSYDLRLSHGTLINLKLRDNFYENSVCIIRKEPLIGTADQKKNKDNIKH